MLHGIRSKTNNLFGNIKINLIVIYVQLLWRKYAPQHFIYDTDIEYCLIANVIFWYVHHCDCHISSCFEIRRYFIFRRYYGVVVKSRKCLSKIKRNTSLFQRRFKFTFISIRVFKELKYAQQCDIVQHLWPKCKFFKSFLVFFFLKGKYYL